MAYRPSLGTLLLLGLVVLFDVHAERQPASPSEVVPFVRLIANPGTFDAKTVVVSGVLRIEFEGNALFFNREQLEHRIDEGNIMLILDRAQDKELKRYHRKYVTLRGVFRARTTGHLGMPIGGSLEAVEFLFENKRQ